MSDTPPWVSTQSTTPYVVKYVTMTSKDWDRFASYYHKRRNEFAAVVKDVLATAQLPLFRLRAEELIAELEASRTSKEGVVLVLITPHARPPCEAVAA